MPITEEITVSSNGVQVAFRWIKDRYEHNFTLGCNKLVAVVEAAIETPVFADLHQQDALLFLSGMSDDRHWSMSIEPTDKGFALDIACRAKSPIEKIGSVYETTTPASWNLSGVAIDSTASPELQPISETRHAIVPEGNLSETSKTVRYRFVVESV